MIEIIANQMNRSTHHALFRPIYIDAETPEEYEKILKKLREEQEILKYQIEQAHKMRWVVTGGYGVYLLFLVVVIIAVS